MGKKGRRRRNKKNKGNNNQQTQKKNPENDAKVEEMTQKLLDTFTGQSDNMQEQSKKIFDSIFQNFLGGQTSKKLTREEILKDKQETMILINEVDEKIYNVMETFEKIKAEKFEEIEGLDDIIDPSDDNSIKNIKLTKKQIKKLKKNNKNFEGFDRREKLLNSKKSEIEKILKAIPEESVCHKFSEEIFMAVNSDLEKTKEIKNLIAVQQIPELLAKKLEVKPENNEKEEIKENA